jgi:outer membrane receptor for ferrienterochelin and colicin
MAQSFSVKPYVGYAQVKLTQVNQDNVLRTTQLSQTAQTSLPYPENFNGNYTIGIQFQYNVEQNNFITFNVHYYRESILSVSTNSDLDAGMIYRFEQTIKYFDFTLGFKYFFNYTSWKSVMFYFSVAGGYCFGNSKPDLSYSDGMNSVQNKGNFSKASLCANVSLGLSIKISRFVELVPEAGYRFENLDQLEGTIQIYQKFHETPEADLEYTSNDYITREKYNFSGFFVSMGLNIVLKFLD